MTWTSRSEPTPLISVGEATFRYPGMAQVAVDGLSVDIPSGQFVALLGHNGSGKSTLVRLLNGLLLPERGSVHVAGFDTAVASERPALRERVGMIFSDPENQIVATTVEDDVAWGLAARGYPRHEIAARVDAALDALGIAELRGRAPHTLSGGQRQRLAIAGIVALQPACILADEPTAMLDPLARREVTDILVNLWRKRHLTLVYVTHLLEEAALAERVIVMEHGRIELDGPPAAIFADLDRLRELRLVVPETAALVAHLRARGVDIPADTLAPEAIVASLVQSDSTAGGRA